MALADERKWVVLDASSFRSDTHSHSVAHGSNVQLQQRAGRQGSRKRPPSPDLNLELSCKLRCGDSAEKKQKLTNVVPEFPTFEEIQESEDRRSTYIT